MNVKHIVRVAVFAATMAIAVPAKSNPTATDPVTPVNTGDAKEIRAQQMVQRLEEIKAIDKSTLTKAERKALRKEVKEIRAEARRDEIKGIYLSIGAVIIIVLLLILIF
jgi:hypothetical protein